MGSNAIFYPSEKSALARSPALSKWIKGWASTLRREVDALEPAGWFERRHDHDGGEMNVDGVWIPNFRSGKFVWSKEPAVTRIVIEELRQARQKRTQLSHVLGVQRL